MLVFFYFFNLYFILVVLRLVDISKVYSMMKFSEDSSSHIDTK